jgi:hypothetical protein
MIQDKATGKLKKRLQDMGLIVNAGADKAEPRPTGNGGKVNGKSSRKGGRK